MLNKDLKIGDTVRAMQDIYEPCSGTLKFKQGTEGVLVHGRYRFPCDVELSPRPSSSCFLVRHDRADMSGMFEKVETKSPAQKKMDELQSYMKDMKANLAATQRQVDSLQEEIENE